MDRLSTARSPSDRFRPYRRRGVILGIVPSLLVSGGTLLAQAPRSGPEAPLEVRSNAAEAAVGALTSQRFAEALRVVDEALGPLVTAKGEADRGVLTLRILKAQALYGLGRHDEAIAALAPFAEARDAPGPLVAAGSDWNALTVLADSLMALDRWGDALPYLERARTMLSADGGVDPRSKVIDTATTLGKIGTTRARLGDWPGARRAFEDQVTVLEGEDAGGGAYLAAAHNGLGLVADNGGDLAAAAVHYATAAEIYEAHFGLEHPYTKRALTTLARVQAKLGDSQEADRITARLATVDAMPSTIPPTLQPVPAGIPDHPAATPMPLVTWPVILAATAAAVLVALAASGFLGRRTRPGDESTDDEPVDPSATKHP